VIKWYLIICFS